MKKLIEKILARYPQLLDILAVVIVIVFIAVCLVISMWVTALITNSQLPEWFKFWLLRL